MARRSKPLPPGGWSRTERRWVRANRRLPDELQQARRRLGPNARTDDARAAKHELAALHDRLERSGAPSARLEPAHELYTEAIAEHLAAVDCVLQFLAGDETQLTAAEAAIERSTAAIRRGNDALDALVAGQR